MLWVRCSTGSFHPLLLLFLHAVVFRVGAKPFLSNSPHFRHERAWDSFSPDSLAPIVSASSVAWLESASIIATKASCPPFNASSPQIILSSPLENEVVDCGGLQEYVFNLNGSCNSDVFSMVIVTVQDNKAPYASVDVSLRSPFPLNSTTYASRSPNRRYYIIQILSTCPGM
jgi:hypothetical protein